MLWEWWNPLGRAGFATGGGEHGAWLFYHNSFSLRRGGYGRFVFYAGRLYMEKGKETCGGRPVPFRRDLCGICGLYAGDALGWASFLFLAIWARGAAGTAGDFIRAQFVWWRGRMP